MRLSAPRLLVRSQGFKLPVVILIPVAAAGGPSWPDIMTAFGTVAAALAAVGIAIWSHGDTSRRIADERRVARDRDQLAEAYRVQVVLGEHSPGGEPNQYGDLDGSVKRLAVMVVNRGSYTITGIEAVFSYDGQRLENPTGYRRLSGFGNVRERLRHGWSPSSERAMHGVLAPWDAGIRFESDEVNVQILKSPYPLVRWTDRWGAQWEHRRGEVRRIRDDEPWHLEPGPESGSSGPVGPGASAPRPRRCRARPQRRWRSSPR